MLDLYFWTTPNGYKVTILLEELGFDYNVVPVHIGKGEQFRPDFLKISPNNKIPVLVDHGGPDGKPFALFESGAIMLYLAEKAGWQFMPSDLCQRYEVVSGSCSRWAGSGRCSARRTISAATPRSRSRTPSSAIPTKGHGCIASSTSDSAKRNFWPAIIRSPTWRSIPGCDRTNGRARISRRGRTCSAGTTPCAGGPPCSVGSQS